MKCCGFLFVKMRYWLLSTNLATNKKEEIVIHAEMLTYSLEEEQAACIIQKMFRIRK